MQKWIILIVVLIIIVLGVFIVMNVNIETEYVPETEISDTELRKTIVTLYFQDKDTKELVKETRLIDSKILLLDPYEELINMLLQGPQNANNERVIAEGTRVIDIKLESNTVTVTLSKEFINSQTEEEGLNKATESIANTLKQFTEVNNVNVIIEGEAPNN